MLPVSLLRLMDVVASVYLRTDIVNGGLNIYASKNCLGGEAVLVCLHILGMRVFIHAFTFCRYIAQGC